MPTVSVVLPVVGDGGPLPTVASVLASTVENVEVIVVSGEAPDKVTGTALDGLKATGARVVLTTTGTSGWPALCNAGIAAAASPYVACIDAGTSVDLTYLERALWVLDHRPLTAIVSPVPPPSGQGRVAPDPQLSDWWPRNPAADSSVFRRDAWQAVGGFDEQLERSCATWDFWLRVIESGRQVAWLREPSSAARDGHSPATNSQPSDESPPPGQTSPGQSSPGQSSTGQSTAADQVLSRHPALGARVPRGRSGLPPTAARAARRTPPYRALAALKGALMEARRQRQLRRWLRAPETSFGVGRAATPAGGGATALVDQKLSPRRDARTGLLFIVPYLVVGGAERVNINVLSQLDTQRFRPIVVTTLDAEHPWAAEFRKYAEIFYAPSLTRSRPEALALMTHLARTRNVKLIQVSNSQLGYELLPDLRRSCSARVVAVLHGASLKRRIGYPRMAVGLDRFIDRYVAVSDRVAEGMVRLGAGRQKVLTIANGVDTELFRPGKSSFLSEAGVEEGQPVIGFVGRIEEVKGPLLFAAAVNELALAGKLQGVAVVVVGDGPMREALRAALAGTGRRHKVIFLGERAPAEISEILRAVSVVVAPSVLEGLPLVGLEAMASGVPIVATRVPGWRELLTDGLTGILVPREPKAIAEAVDNLLSDTQRAQAIGARARGEAVTNYSIQVMGRKWQALYSELLS